MKTGIKKLEVELISLSENSEIEYDEIEFAITGSETSDFNKGYLCGKMSCYNSNGDNTETILEKLIEDCKYLNPNK